MKPKVYTITEAKAQLSDIVRRVKRGELIAIGVSRNPEVKLSIYSPNLKNREFGKLAGEIWIASDFTRPDPAVQQLFEGE